MTYATAQETASVMRQATPDELWLHQQLDRIDPHRYEQGSAGDTPALVKLVFELRANAAEKSVHKAAANLIKLANAQDCVVTIERKACRPLAMGNASYVIDVRPARGKS